ncbi:MAG: hypothetical protein PHW62_00845 [Candidatus Ratteibacteria bacterium]|nr:hypothetical protein [Candidatus Ratteibacteria bacterium]
MKLNKTNIMIDKTDGLVRTRPRDPQKLEVFCILAEAAVSEGVIFKGNEIVEILPWDD